LLVGEKEAEEVFNLTEGDKVEIGPFVVSPSVHLPDAFRVADQSILSHSKEGKLAVIGQQI